MKCVRVDRCWALSRAGYGDVKWHRLPGRIRGASSRRRAFWAQWTAFPWPETATYDVATTPEGARAVQRRQHARPDLSLVETTVIDGSSVADTLFVVGADNSLEPARDRWSCARRLNGFRSAPRVARGSAGDRQEHLASGHQQLRMPAR